MRRSWLFVPGADETAHAAAARSGADVIVLELEDFTPPQRRERARALSSSAFARWRKAGAIAAVRVNPLEGDGMADLAALGRNEAPPDILMMSKVDTPEQVRRLEAAFEKARAAGKERARVGGALVEVPVYAAAKRLLARGARS